MFVRHSSLLVIMAMATTVGFAGCEKQATVEGKIEFNGKRIGDGQVVFHFGKGKQVVANVTQGKFPLTPTYVGPAKVVVKARGVPAKYGSLKTTDLQLKIENAKNVISLTLE